MNPCSEDLKDMLEAESSLSLTFGTNLFIGKEPTTPTNSVTIFDTPGANPMLTVNNDEDYRFPSAQIRIRNNSYLTGRSMAEDIYTFLHGKNHETWNSTVYQFIRCVNEPYHLGNDENGHPWWIINLNIQRSQ